MSTTEDDLSGQSSPTKATRRRGTALTSAIREATIAVLREHGYSGTTFGSVASQANTSRSVLYRKYRSRAHMVADALMTQVPSPDTNFSSTGSLREDLRILVEQVAIAQLLFDPEITRRIVGEADSSLVAEITGARFKPFVESMRFVFAAARERGEMGAARIPYVTTYAPIAMLRVEALERPLTADFLDSLVDDVILPLFVTVSNRTEAELTPHQPRNGSELSPENLSRMWQLTFQGELSRPA